MKKSIDQQKNGKQQSSATPATAVPSGAQKSGNDADALLKRDHRTVEQLFNQYKTEQDPSKKEEIAEKVCLELIVHTKLEEELFYPACREKGVMDSSLDEAQVEHDDAKILIADILNGNVGEQYFDAKVSVLSEYIMHHVREEEKPRDGIFAKAKSSGVDMTSLGTQLQQRKQELMAGSDAIRSEALELISLHPQNLDTTMPNNSNYRERDEEGRFMSEDDNRGGRSRSRNEGRGWYGDSEGHSMAAEKGWDEREGHGRSNYRSRDYDEDGYSRSGRSNDGYSNGRGQGGWFGDPEGHSEAAERGWERREGGRGGSSYRSRGSDDDDRGYGRGRGRDHGGWFGDPEGHSEAAELGWERREGGRGGSSYRSRGYDDNDREYNRGGYRGDGRGHGGWFGDPEGHSEAAELGWERREGGRGGSSYRSRSYDDDRGGSRNGRGHGGWFGDPRGHSEASREGWANR